MDSMNCATKGVVWGVERGVVRGVVKVYDRGAG